MEIIHEPLTRPFNEPHFCIGKDAKGAQLYCTPLGLLEFLHESYPGATAIYCENVTNWMEQRDYLVPVLVTGPGLHVMPLARGKRWTN